MEDALYKVEGLWTSTVIVILAAGSDSGIERRCTILSFLVQVGKRKVEFTLNLVYCPRGKGADGSSIKYGSVKSEKVANPENSPRDGWGVEHT